MRNKRGVEQVIAVYWFAILIIVAVGISAMVFTFYKHPYDVREVEANILMNKIADCISQHGVINEQIINKMGDFQQDFDMEKLCNINFNSPDYDKEGHEQYYVLINFYDMSNNLKFQKSGGNDNLKTNCIGQEETKDETTLPKCLTGNLFAIDLKNKQYSIEILTGVLKTKQNVQ